MLYRIVDSAVAQEYFKIDMFTGYLSIRRMLSENQAVDKYEVHILTFTILWANSADNNFMIFFLIFPENRI